VPNVSNTSKPVANPAKKAMVRSPLQWALQNRQLDIAQLLISRGASVDHISTLGWTPIFYLWPRARASQPVMVDYLTVLSADTFLELEILDTWGWTVLHRVAAFGTAVEVEALLKLGASPMTCALPLRWNAIHHAVFYGNYSTFVTLLPLYSHMLIDTTDERGWTLLHIAASAGHENIVRHLLRLGANPYSLSKPFRSHMPE